MYNYFICAQHPHSSANNYIRAQPLIRYLLRIAVTPKRTALFHTSLHTHEDRDRIETERTKKGNHIVGVFLRAIEEQFERGWSRLELMHVVDMTAIVRSVMLSRRIPLNNEYVLITFRDATRRKNAGSNPRVRNKFTFHVHAYIRVQLICGTEPKECFQRVFSRRGRSTHTSTATRSARHILIVDKYTPILLIWRRR